MDKITIKNLEIFANHGVFPEENKLGQKFVITAILYTDTRKAGKTDDLSASINYGEVSVKITEFVQGHTFMLLERLLEELAQELLLTYESLKEVTLEVKKPWAPVHLPLETVSVEITRGWHKAYVALGSNMGDRTSYLQMGVDTLAAHPLCRKGQVSDFITTAPYGYLEQDDFLNGVMELDTLLTPEELLDLLHEGEQKANRVREIHWGPRTLDLDILFYDQEIIDTETLHIPHIDMQKRDFVLKPMDQIAPWFRHPVLNKTMHELWMELCGEH